MHEKEGSDERVGDAIRESVREHYRKAINKEKPSCRGGDEVSQVRAAKERMLEKAGYSRDQIEAFPEDMLEEFMGSGNPTALAQIERGQTVLDVGSGAGIDCLIAAMKTGPEGKVVGLDMTTEMIGRARLNADRMGLKNIEFRQGYIEDMPIEDASVDIAISNCVINLSPSKEKVFAEIHRVLKEGGKMLISDIVTENLPEPVQKSIWGWCSCISGARSEAVYTDMIKKAGFNKVDVIQRKIYDEKEIKSLASKEAARQLLAAHGGTAEDMAKLLSGKIASVSVCAVK